MTGATDVALAGRVSVVTGAASGIGRATALGLADLGSDLVVSDRDAEGLAALVDDVRALDRTILEDVLDVRDVAATSAHVTRAVEEFGHIDVLVNNAGGGFQSPFVDVSANGQAALIAENFTSATDMIRHVVPAMGPASSIVNITSIEAHRAGPGFSIYAAMKAALANLTKTLAVELGGRGIRVNSVAPDVISTPGVGEMGVRAPLAREGAADDVAGVVAFLAGPWSAFVTGAMIPVDGGMAAAGGWRRAGDGTFLTPASVHSGDHPGT